MKIERVKNTKRNIIWGTTNKIVTLVCPFIIRTVLIYTLGLEYLGLSSLFTSILQVLNMAELGISSVIVFSMYKPIAENDEEKICALLMYYKKAYRIIGSIILVVGLALMPFLKYLIKGSYPADINLYVLYLLYLFNTVISYFLFAYRNCLLTAHQRNDIASNISTVTYLLQYILQIILLFLFRNYYWYYIAVPVCAIVNNLITAFLTRKMYPQYKCKGKLGNEEKAFIKKNISGLMLGKVCVTSRNSLDNIFISSYIGLTAVAIYGNYYYILSAIIGFLQVICTAISAGVGNSIASETAEKNYNDLKKISFLYSWIAGWCAICLLNLYQPFMMIWVGEEQMLSMVEVILFSLYFYSLTLGDIRSQYSSAAGLWWEGRFYVAAETIGNFVLNWLLVRWFGIAGVIAATLITIILCNFIWGSNIVFKYYFKTISSKEFFINHAKQFIVVAIVGAITWWININFVVFSNNFVDLIAKGIVCVIIPNILFWLVYRKTELFHEAVGLVKKLFK